jgi:uncharacterized membrane protein
MIVPRLPLLVLWSLVALQAIVAWLQAAELPDPVASHFDGAGMADGFMDRTTFLLVYVGLSVFVAALFTGVAWLLPRLPTAFLNLPRKDHWLAPERREATFRRMNGMLLWVAAVTVVLFLVLFHLTVLANQRAGQPRLPDGAAVILLGYAAAILAVVALGLLPFLRRK